MPSFVPILNKTSNETVSHNCSHATMAEKCTKKRDAHGKLLFCLSKPIAFLPFSLPSPSSLRKLPIGGFVTGLYSTEAPLCCSEAGEKEKESMQSMIQIITFIGIPGGRLCIGERTGLVTITSPWLTYVKQLSANFCNKLNFGPSTLPTQSFRLPVLSQVPNSNYTILIITRSKQKPVRLISKQRGNLRS